MLSQLYIENVAVIEKCGLNFDAGFNVLTGETGAGKSILIDSINAILGNRANLTRADPHRSLLRFCQRRVLLAERPCSAKAHGARLFR